MSTADDHIRAIRGLLNRIRQHGGDDTAEAVEHRLDDLELYIARNTLTPQIADLPVSPAQTPFSQAYDS